MSVCRTIVLLLSLSFLLVDADVNNDTVSSSSELLDDEGVDSVEERKKVLTSADPQGLVHIQQTPHNTSTIISLKGPAHRRLSPAYNSLSPIRKRHNSAHLSQSPILMPHPDVPRSKVQRKNRASKRRATSRSNT